MIPTQRMWVLICLGVPLGALAFQVGAPWALLAYNLLLLSAAVTDFRICPNARNLKIRRNFDPVLSVRVANRVGVEVTNDGLEPLIGRFRDESPAGSTAERNEHAINLEAGRIAEFSYTVTPHRRGSDFFRGTFLRLRCPLGLIERQWKLNTEQPVRIYPNILALREFDLLKQRGKLRQIGIRKSRIRGLGTEFESLRDYTLGDDYRKIDWKATARRNKLVVRQFEQERNQSVILCIDVGRRMLSEVNGVSKLDHVLDSVLMLAHAVAQAGDLVGLLVYSDNVRRYIPPKKGRSQVGIIIEALHDLVAEPVETDFISAFSYLGTRYKRRSLIVNFTDLDGPDEASSFLTAFHHINRRHLALIARVGDPMLKAMAKGAIHANEDFYAKAAALFVSEDRKAAGTSLSNADIHHLEAEPQDLASELVSFYFMVKERSLL